MNKIDDRGRIIEHFIGRCPQSPCYDDTEALTIFEPEQMLTITKFASLYMNNHSGIDPNSSEYIILSNLITDIESNLKNE